MEETIYEKSDELVMKLLHYFITEQGYSPIVLHGAKNEIWLENLEQNYQVVRIVSNYIHNEEQMNFDLYRTSKILKKVKKKTCSIHIEALSLFINLGDHVSVKEYERVHNISCAQITKVSDFKNYTFITEAFPNIVKKTSFKEKGADLFMKLTQDITRKNEEESKKAEDVFQMKSPIVTYILIAVNVILFLATYLYGNGSRDVKTLLDFGANYAPFIRGGEYYRLLASAFLHAGVIHLLVNMYALYIIGPQIESFLGKTKYLCIYLGSAIAGSLLSITFTNQVSVGASGAIFGLFGSLLYFGYHYRIYLGNVIKSQIVPLILLNLMVGFLISGIDTAAHIGGLIGGCLLTMALGVKYKSTRFEKGNGWIMSMIYVGFLLYMAFCMSH